MPARLEDFSASVIALSSRSMRCRAHESLRSTPAMALGIADKVWTIGDLVDVALATQPIDPVVTAPDRRRRFKVIDGGKE